MWNLELDGLQMGAAPVSQEQENWRYSSYELTKIEKLGLTSLRFCCSIQMVESEFA